MGAKPGEQAGHRIGIAQSAKQGVDARGAHRRKEVAQIEPQHQAAAGVRRGEADDRAAGAVAVGRLVGRDVAEQPSSSLRWIALSRLFGTSRRRYLPEDLRSQRSV